MNIITKINELQDPRMEGRFLMSSPINPTIITILYLAFCLKIGPNFMKSRKPFKLTTVMLLVNILQIITNTYYVLKYAKQTVKMSLICEPAPTGTSPQDISYVDQTHFYAVLKFFDFFDTVVYTLRKKESQVTFLHLFHHIGVANLVWLGCNYFPAGTPLWATWINSAVHALMYLYYLISSQIKISKKWKKALTAIQLVHQFVSVAILLIALLNPTCTYPKWYLLSLMGYIAIVIVLFFNFYNKSYTKNK